jgi:hypothetical protein
VIQQLAQEFDAWLGSAKNPGRPNSEVKTFPSASCKPTAVVPVSHHAISR